MLGRTTLFSCRNRARWHIFTRRACADKHFCTVRHEFTYAMTYSLSLVHSLRRVRRKIASKECVKKNAWGEFRKDVPGSTSTSNVNNRCSSISSCRMCIPHRCGQTRAFAAPNATAPNTNAPRCYVRLARVTQSSNVTSFEHQGSIEAWMETKGNEGILYELQRK